MKRAAHTLLLLLLILVVVEGELPPRLPGRIAKVRPPPLLIPLL